MVKWMLKLIILSFHELRSIQKQNHLKWYCSFFVFLFYWVSWCLWIFCIVLFFSLINLTPMSAPDYRTSPSMVWSDPHSLWCQTLQQSSSDQHYLGWIKHSRGWSTADFMQFYVILCDFIIYTSRRSGMPGCLLLFLHISLW